MSKHQTLKSVISHSLNASLVPKKNAFNKLCLLTQHNSLNQPNLTNGLGLNCVYRILAKFIWAFCTESLTVRTLFNKHCL